MSTQNTRHAKRRQRGRPRGQQMEEVESSPLDTPSMVLEAGVLIGQGPYNPTFYPIDTLLQKR